MLNNGCNGFYCATQICIARTCYGNVSGWLSVTRRYCIKRAKPILKPFQPSGSTMVSSDPCADNQFQAEFLQIHDGGKSWWFSTEISVYFGNGARLADGYYWTLIGSHGCRIEWYNFRWHWVTPNPGFKVTVYLQVEYLKKRCVLGTKLLQNAIRKPYSVYLMVPLSWVTFDPDFKVTTFFDTEYLRNDTTR